MGGGLHAPLAVLSTWPAHPSEHPYTRNWSFCGALLFLWAVSFAAVCGRMLVRLHFMRNAGWDDVFICIAMFFLTSLFVCAMGAFKIWGFDRHVWDLTVPEAVNGRKAVLAIEAQYILATHLTKISILLFYRRLSSGTFSAWFVWAIRAMIVVVVLSFVGLELTLFNACKPFNAFWNEVDFDWAALNKYTCYDEGAGQYATIVSGAFQDLIACLIPMVLIMKLPLPKRQKVALFGLFSLGLITVSLALFRAYYIFKVYYDSYDVTYWAGPAFLLAGIESSMGVTCASMPALKFYFSGYFNETDSNRPFRGFGNWSIKMTNWTKSHRAPTTSKDMPTSTVSSMWRDLSRDVTPDGERYTSEPKLGLSKDPLEADWSSDLELGGISVTHEVEVVASSPVFPQWPLPTRHPAGPYVAFSNGSDRQFGGRRESVQENDIPSWLDDSSVHELEWRRCVGR